MKSQLLTLIFCLATAASADAGEGPVRVYSIRHSATRADRFMTEVEMLKNSAPKIEFKSDSLAVLREGLKFHWGNFDSDYIVGELGDWKEMFPYDPPPTWDENGVRRPKEFPKRRRYLHAVIELFASPDMQKAWARKIDLDKQLRHELEVLKHFKAPIGVQYELAPNEYTDSDWRIAALPTLAVMSREVVKLPYETIQLMLQVFEDIRKLNPREGNEVQECDLYTAMYYWIGETLRNQGAISEEHLQEYKEDMKKGRSAYLLPGLISFTKIDNAFWNKNINMGYIDDLLLAVLDGEISVSDYEKEISKQASQLNLREQKNLYSGIFEYTASKYHLRRRRGDGLVGMYPTNSDSGEVDVERSVLAGNDSEYYDSVQAMFERVLRVLVDASKKVSSKAQFKKPAKILFEDWWRYASLCAQHTALFSELLGVSPKEVIALSHAVILRHYKDDQYMRSAHSAFKLYELALQVSPQSENSDPTLFSVLSKEIESDFLVKDASGISAMALLKLQKLKIKRKANSGRNCEKLLK